MKITSRSVFGEVGILAGELRAVAERFERVATAPPDEGQHFNAIQQAGALMLEIVRGRESGRRFLDRLARMAPVDFDLSDGERAQLTGARAAGWHVGGALVFAAMRAAVLRRHVMAVPGLRVPDPGLGWMANCQCDAAVCRIVAAMALEAAEEVFITGTIVKIAELAGRGDPRTVQRKLGAALRREGRQRFVVSVAALDALRAENGLAPLENSRTTGAFLPETATKSRKMKNGA